jgi:predicted SprT family Zn-dependent metalloprotease
MNRMDLVKKKFDELVVMATDIYGINMGLLTLKTTIKSKNLGRATMGFSPIKLEINLNINAINGTDKQFEFVLEETLPHEMAHIVNFLSPRTGKNHDRGWKNVCRVLGGSGKAKFSYSDVGEISSYKAPKKYIYNVKGTDVALGTVRHNRLQSGKDTYHVTINYKSFTIFPHMFTGQISDNSAGCIS